MSSGLVRRLRMRSGVLALAMVAMLGLVAACGGGDDPTPTATGAAPTATSPAPTATSPIAPGETRVPPTPTATAPSAPAWEAQWDALVAAAKEEGTVNIAVTRAAYRSGAEPFQDAFPDIQMEFQVGSSSSRAGRILQEVDAGVHSLDVALTGSSSFYIQWSAWEEAHPGEKVMGDTRAAMIRPDVFEDVNWEGSFDDRFVVIPDRKHFITWIATVGGAETYVNRELLPESVFNSYQDLFRPELKGRWCMLDPRQFGSSEGWVGQMMLTMGTDFVRRVFAENPPKIDVSYRNNAQELMAGDMLVCADSYMQEFWDEGIGLQVERWLPGALPIDEEFLDRGLLSNCCGTGSRKAELDGFWSSGTGGPMITAFAPNPNAAAVFTNWALTTEGQIAMVEPHGWLRLCSARADLQDRCERENKIEDGKSFLATDRTDVIWMEALAVDLIRFAYEGR